MTRFSVASLLLAFSINLSFSQSTTGATGNIITTAMPFLTISSDSRTAGMADLGAATSPDANAIFTNPGKLAFNEDRAGFSVSFTPWLRQLGIKDMWIGYLAGYIKPKDRDIEAIGFHLNYFNLGQIQFTDQFGASAGEGNPKEFSAGLTYSRKLSEKVGLGIGVKYLNSNLASGFQLAGADNLKPARTVAGDLGLYYTNEVYISGRIFDWSLGAAISNLGSKVTYSSSNNSAFIPTNLRLGTFLQTEIDEYNKIGFGVDFNKLLVPTPDPSDASNANQQDQSVLSGVFSSFGDAPGGFSEELQEIMISLGAEYWYQSTFAVRAGYFYESKEKGNRKYISAGAGLKYQDFGLDLAYLIPVQQNNPLANTIRITVRYTISE